MELVPIGATNLLTVISISCSIFLAIGQLVFQRSILNNLSGTVSQEVADRVISAGATNLHSVVDTADLPAVIQAYGKSVTQVFVSYSPLARKLRVFPSIHYRIVI